ncbi:hypothetical protein EVAR_35965_1 [Eumeta japonica]|uniref:Uncharacterized protein n=1 Tax=Eumeta variegata TaxID=151549 RepID=A0A4C1W2G5_EUMVA|nr:hypothetical protein EVAR_35965_1 [Eumeta japonica]
MEGNKPPEFTLTGRNVTGIEYLKEEGLGRWRGIGAGVRLWVMEEKWATQEPSFRAKGNSRDLPMFLCEHKPRHLFAAATFCLISISFVILECYYCDGSKDHASDVAAYRFPLIGFMRSVFRFSWKSTSLYLINNEAGNFDELTGLTAPARARERVSTEWKHDCGIETAVPVLRIDDSSIAAVTEVKVLGVHLDLKFGKHATEIGENVAKSFVKCALSRMCAISWGLKQLALKLICKATFGAAITYTSAV